MAALLCPGCCQFASLARQLGLFTCIKPVVMHKFPLHIIATQWKRTFQLSFWAFLNMLRLVAVFMNSLAIHAVEGNLIQRVLSKAIWYIRWFENGPTVRTVFILKEPVFNALIATQLVALTTLHHLKFDYTLTNRAIKPVVKWLLFSL